MRYSVGLALAFVFALAGCDDLTGLRVDPLLATDTVDLVTPTSENTVVGTALDIVATNGIIGGSRHPERAANAQQWDFAVRVRDGSVVLLPPGALGLGSGPLLTRALDGRTFDDVTRAPDRAAFVADSAVVMQTGSVYVARSRTFAGVFGSCFQYAKLQPLIVDPAAGALRVQLTTNERCGDNRLAE